VVQVIGNSSTHGLTRPARELLFTVVSRDDKYRAKNAIDTIGYRFGDLASSWLNKGLAALGGSALAVATRALAAAWLTPRAVARLAAGRGFPPRRGPARRRRPRKGAAMPLARRWFVLGSLAAGAAACGTRRDPGGATAAAAPPASSAPAPAAAARPAAAVPT